MSTGCQVTANQMRTRSPESLSPISVSPELTHTGHFVNGAIAALVSIVLTQPLFALKTYRMNHLGIPPLRKLYSGLLPNSASLAPGEGVAFLIQNATTKALNSPTPTTMQNLLVSSLAGAASSPINTLFERGMILQQTQGGSLLRIIKPLLASEGVLKGLFKGGIPTMYREAIFNSGIFAFSDMGKTILKPQIPSEKKLIVVSSITAGTVAGFFSTPFDRIKTLMQSDTQNRFTTMRGTFRHIYLTEGAKGLFHGGGIRATLVGAAIAAIGLSKEELPPHLPDRLHITLRQP